MHLRAPASLPRPRGVAGDTVLFSSAAGSTVRLDGADPSIAAITFSSSTSFTIAAGSGGVLHLANGGSRARITVSSGSHTISAPVELDSNLTVLPAAGSQLTISGGITGAAVLTVDDRGKVILSGTNGYTGGTAVSAGTLIVSSASAIPANSNLTVGAGASQFFASAIPFSAATAASSIAGSAAATAGDATAAKTAAKIAKIQADSSTVFLKPEAADIVHARLARSNLRSPIVPPPALAAWQSFAAAVVGPPAPARKIAGDRS